MAARRWTRRSRWMIRARSISHGVRGDRAIGRPISQPLRAGWKRTPARQAMRIDSIRGLTLFLPPRHWISEMTENGNVNRRDVVQVLAAGAAATVATPAVAQSASIVAEAAAADYARDPTRWGTAEVAAFFPGFRHLDLRTPGAIIRVRHGGSGPPLLMLHGYPNSHASWYKIAARLADRYHVVLADLRGYGDSSLPEPGPNQVNYSKRVMAEDMISVMEQLG